MQPDLRPEQYFLQSLKKKKHFLCCIQSFQDRSVRKSLLLWPNKKSWLKLHLLAFLALSSTPHNLLSSWNLSGDHTVSTIMPYETWVRIISPVKILFVKLLFSWSTAIASLIVFQKFKSLCRTFALCPKLLEDQYEVWAEAAEGAVALEWRGWKPASPYSVLRETLTHVTRGVKWLYGMSASFPPLKLNPGVWNKRSTAGLDCCENMILADELSY